jgi:hypothetical protein
MPYTSHGGCVRLPPPKSSRQHRAGNSAMYATCLPYHMVLYHADTGTVEQGSRPSQTVTAVQTPGGARPGRVSHPHGPPRASHTPTSKPPYTKGPTNNGLTTFVPQSVFWAMVLKRVFESYCSWFAQSLHTTRISPRVPPCTPCPSAPYINTANIDTEYTCHLQPVISQVLASYHSCCGSANVHGGM